MGIKEQERLILSWKNVSGWIDPVRKWEEPKKILNDVSGTARSGVLTAIVSPSGAGKTTLLAILGMRFKGKTEGEIRLNGSIVSREIMSNISGFVYQKEHTYQDLTVEEHLTFMALLKMEKSTNTTSARKKVLKVVDELSLNHRLNSKIGRLSGGQKKRLTLATQLLTEPKILLCDEPTTGLDSFNAVRVVQLLHSLANNNKMIICSIHQPASGIFEMFDDVSLLVDGGRLGYHGPVSAIDSFFASLDMKCPENFNLCEFIVSQVTCRYSEKDGVHKNEDKAGSIVARYRLSEVYENLKTELASIPTKSIRLSVDWERSPKSFGQELRLLLWRAVILLKRSRKALFLRFLACFFVFFIISTPYGRIKLNQEGVQNINGYLNIFTVQILYAAISSIVHVFPEEIPVFVQEVADRAYSPLAFYISKVFSLSILVLLQSYLFNAYAFTVVGFCNSIDDYFLPFMPTLVLSLMGVAYGFFLSAAFRSIETYSLFSTPFEMISIILTGFSVKITSLPWFIRWMKYLSFPYYAYESTSILQWIKHDHIECNRAFKRQCYETGDKVLESLGFDRNDLTLDFSALIGYTLLCHVLAFIFLRLKMKRYAAY